MAMPSADFLTRRQMKEQIALPKVGVRYSDGRGGVRDFGVSDASELGSLDAAFGAAAAGVKRDRNLDLANLLNGKGSVKAADGSGVVVKDGVISLKGEAGGKSNEKQRFFGTDGMGSKGWHKIDEIDRPEKGAIVGRTQNVEAKADDAKREVGKGDGCWSYEVSRSAFKKDENTGVVQMFNYFKTIYLSEFGRVVGQSAETEVLVGTIEGGTANMDAYLFCAKPVFGDGDATKTGPIKAVQFATARQFKVIAEGQGAVDEAQAEYDAVKDDPQIAPQFKQAKLDALNEAKATLQNAEAVVKTLTVGEFGVKAEFENNILSKLLFGTAYDLQQNATDTSKVKAVSTQVGCPYQS